MRTSSLPSWPVLLLIVVLSGFLLAGIRSVPFHPDESTHLYMSADLRMLLIDPLSLAYDPIKQTDARMAYRLLDAPLTRYLLGAGLGLSGQAPLQADWDWSQSRDQNRASGAFPGERQLLAGRLAVALTIPLSLFLIYLSGGYLGGVWAGCLAVLLLCLNALVLLHCRRAMAEGALLLGTCAFLASLLVADRRPWLAGLTLGLAFSAKQSSLVLLPVGLLAVCWSAEGSWLPRRRIVIGTWQYLFAFGLLTITLNPFLWTQPISAVQAAIETRRELFRRQAADVQESLPQHYLNTPGERVVVLLGNLYLAPPMFAEVGNYRTETAEAETMYLANPLHSLGRNLPGAGLFLGLSLCGLLAGVVRARRAKSIQRRALMLYLLATLILVGSPILLIPLAWQRYVIPLVPLVCLWISLCLIWLGEPLLKTGWQLTNRLIRFPFYQH